MKNKKIIYAIIGIVILISMVVIIAIISNKPMPIDHTPKEATSIIEELKKKYTPYTESERMSYIREYLSTSETKYQFAKRTGICRRLLILWLDKYHINDKVMSTEQPSLRKASDESLNELEKELAALRAENRKLQRALQEESLRHEACEELINLAESTYHIKVRKNSDAK